MKKEIMTRAWEIAREAVKSFGGKVREYISEALKMAWRENRGMKKAILVGSEKQIAWEEDIREMFIKRITEEHLLNPVGGFDSVVSDAEYLTKEEMGFVYSVRYEEAKAAARAEWKANGTLKGAWKEIQSEVKADYVRSLYRNFVELVRTETSAKFWIENRIYN